jgi:hypothetical protein
LYGYNGNLSTAVASNSKYNEIAFEGFEEYTAGQSVSPTNASSGNFSMFTTVPAASDYKVLYKEYEVESARGNLLTVLLAPDNSLVNSKVKVFGANFSTIENGVEVSSFNCKNIYGDFTIKSVQADPSGDPTKSVIELDNSMFSNTSIWKGKISIPYIIGTSNLPIVSVGGGVSVVNTTAHTGKQSIMLSGQVQMEQERLSLLGPKYVFSCWMSMSNSNVYSYQASGQRGVQFQFISKTGTSTYSTIIEPSGGIIEGWQKIEAEVVVPSNTVRTIISFNAPQISGNDQYYFDDIRISPSLGNMQTYVYNPTNLKLSAVLDNNNYATYYYYDQQGNLFLVKKETERGVMTIQESFSHTRE